LSSLAAPAAPAAASERLLTPSLAQQPSSAEPCISSVGCLAAAQTLPCCPSPCHLRQAGTAATRLSQFLLSRVPASSSSCCCCPASTAKAAQESCPGKLWS
jgi:hypothetical protein